MGLLKKKSKKKEVPPPLPQLQYDVVMSGDTTMTMTEEGVPACMGVFQTDQPLSAAEWETLARKAMDGHRFVLMVVEKDGEDKDND